MRSRNEAIAAVRAVAGEPQIIIAGGGINGIGLYRDLALQGVPALLVDKADFASGTTAAPSRLIHGGLRYLETGEFELVRESVIERNHLIRNAPHLVKPLPVWVPAFNWFGGIFSAGLRFLKLKKTPGAKGILVVKLGLVFFDRFGRKNRMMPDHRIVSRAELARRMPGLSPRVTAIAEYYDARLTHPERLALELVGDAERDCPKSVAVPYMALAGHEGDTVRLRDEISGEEIAVKAKMVINCTGAWADEADGRLGIDKRLIGGTRGSHLVMRRPDIARQLGDGMLYFETRDFRACLVYALDDELILLGTTDIRAQNPDTVACSEEEIDYLFDVLDQVLPNSKAKREEIVFAYAGIRPLPYSGDGATGAISRDHSLKTFEPEGTRRFPVLTLVGGKWTTYRACAEQIADEVLTRLNLKRTRSTLDAAIGGGAGHAREAAARARQVDDVARGNGLDTVIATRLVNRYGTRANLVAQAVAAPGGRDTVDERGLYHVGEIGWILANERVTRLSDIVLRRTLMPFEGAVTLSGLERLARLAGNHLGWSPERQAEEVVATAALLQTRHRVELGTAPVAA
ncbi:glycerol-3-phosphate dehydrogenase [Rhizobium sp. RU20A]|uniref:glycerol-3-phosphate dehydrogenase/oxidase n=1 Tax=Rhizobium sp. RU20A TaxID=1907412 RepID=UPI000956426D|nr:glycerol-3-phosphate dehydrogenase/oxidase [Rhizobium sp. RU20A]SIQ68055.1 glycerol-3-phosphate dehydrogenase [Rhizobium sp. RU20A]